MQKFTKWRQDVRLGLHSRSIKSKYKQFTIAFSDVTVKEAVPERQKKTFILQNTKTQQKRCF